MSRTRNDEAAVLARRLRAMQRPAAITEPERAWYAQAISDGDGGVVGTRKGNGVLPQGHGLMRGDHSDSAGFPPTSEPEAEPYRTPSVAAVRLGPSPTPICSGPARWMCVAVGEHLCGEVR